MFANCFPTSINIDQFNYQSGQHEMVEYGVEFRCTKYESIQINALAKALLEKYKILTNSMNFHSGIRGFEDDYTRYDFKTGKLKSSMKKNSIKRHYLTPNEPISEKEVRNYTTDSNKLKPLSYFY